MKLEDIATLSVGQILTRVTDDGSEIIYKVLQPKAIDNGVINDEQLDTVNVSKEIDADKFTKKGDVVIKLSTPYEAAVIDEKHVGLLIPSFCAVLRTQKDINPYFICALINSSYIKEQIKSKIAGTVRPMVKISDLRTVEIPEITSDKMSALGKEYELSLNKLDLLIKIISTEKEIMDNKLLAMVLEEDKNE